MDKVDECYYTVVIRQSFVSETSINRLLLKLLSFVSNIRPLLSLSTKTKTVAIVIIVRLLLLLPLLLWWSLRLLWWQLVVVLLTAQHVPASVIRVTLLWGTTILPLSGANSTPARNLVPSKIRAHLISSNPEHPVHSRTANPDFQTLNSLNPKLPKP